jgi:hypothetical protein
MCVRACVCVAVGLYQSTLCADSIHMLTTQILALASPPPRWLCPSFVLLLHCMGCWYRQRHRLLTTRVSMHSELLFRLLDMVVVFDMAGT